MWLDNLRQIKQDSGMKTTEIAKRAKLPERTVRRVFSGDTANPYVDTLDRIATAMGATLADVLVDTKAVVGTHDLATLQILLDEANAGRELLIAEISVLKDKLDIMSAENDRLRRELLHKEELLAVHNYYTKIKSGG